MMRKYRRELWIKYNAKRYKLASYLDKMSAGTTAATFLKKRKLNKF
jgi:hypothetical protein